MGGWYAGNEREKKGHPSAKVALKERIACVAAWVCAFKPSTLKDRHIVIITHGALWSRLFPEILGAPMFGNTSMDNCSVTHLEIMDHGRDVRVHCLNWKMPLFPSVVAGSEGQPSST